MISVTMATSQIDTCRGYLIGAGYFSTTEGVAEALARYGGPGLAEFEAGAATTTPRRRSGRPGSEWVFAL